MLFIQLTSLFITVLDAKKDTQALASVEREGQFVYSRMLYDISRAEALLEPATLGETSNRIRLTIDGVEYIYEVSGSLLTLSVGGVTTPLHTSTQATEFTATRLGKIGGMHTVQLQFRLTSPIQEATGSETRLYQTTVGLRQ